MALRTLLIAAVLLAPTLAQAQGWQRYASPSSGVRVDLPTAIFTEAETRPDAGPGRRFVTADRRADLIVLSEPNPDDLSPAKFLARKGPPADIIYRRVTPRFFVVSSIRQGRIWYNRCNRASGAMHCVLINYPAAEKRRWDAIVTRISHSLSGGA